MNELTKTLSELAAKFGVAVEHLYGVLINQAQVEVYRSLFITVVLVILWVIIIYVHKKLSRTDEDRLNRYDNSEALVAIMALSGTILSIFSIIFLIYLLTDVVDAIFNPEYWALKQILNH
jgi:flagellar biosynthesis protein FlhB